MPIRTKRWNDPATARDGLRVLVCRYRPRGVRKSDESWDEWLPDLGPSRELLAAYHGKPPPPIPWSEFRRRYIAEMRERRDMVEELAAKVRSGRKVTLLCSSACQDPERCHRTVLAGLLEQAIR
jgi:uncharacterized protein YeaO (DUF488 family)